MSLDSLKVIINGLNNPPFNRGLSIITFDAMSPERLLQSLSDVLCWIESVDIPVDIRSESPDETALRVLNALRILKYPPPEDIDSVQNWRRGILEGNKAAIYPILEWIFQNVDRLKERIYLANYLTKTDVPSLEQTPEILRLMMTVEQKMEEFKNVHSKIVEMRSDFARAEDIRTDLGTMETEKEQLERKVQRARLRLDQRSDVVDFLQMAANGRREAERRNQLHEQKQEQREALLAANQRLNRWRKVLTEIEEEREAADVRKLVNKLKDEVETNTYLAKEKLPTELKSLREKVDGAYKILSVANVNAEEIDRLRKKIENLSSTVMDMTTQRDNRDEENAEKQSIYRHQATGVQRKKVQTADRLQSLRNQMEQMENRIERKKTELGLTSEAGEQITTIQFKNYSDKMRTKSNHYKKKKTEMDTLKGEIDILENTKDLLEKTWNSLRSEIHSEGRHVIEGDKWTASRPKTAKPETNDVTVLKQLIQDQSNIVAAKRRSISELQTRVQTASQTQRKQNEDYLANEEKVTAFEKQWEENISALKLDINGMEDRKRRAILSIENLEESLKVHRQLIADMETGDVEITLQHLEEENNRRISEAEGNRSALRDWEQREDAAMQKLMWKSLSAVFSKKISLQKRVNEKPIASDHPIGDLL